MDPQIASLQSYISQQLRLGQTPDTITQQLQTANWQLDMIYQAFAAVQAGMIPSAMQQAATTSMQLPQANGASRGRIRNGWLLFKTSVKILRGNPDLWRYLMETLAGVVVANGIFFSIAVFFFHALSTGGGGTVITRAIFIALNYVVVYFIINFFAAAMAKNIMDIFRGIHQDHSVYINAARSKAWPILLFTIIESIVGIILRYVVERIRFIGWILSYLLGTAWSLGTMFVLPIIIETDTPALPAIKQSIHFFKQSWGEGVTAKLALNIPLILPAIVIVLLLFPAIIAAATFGGVWAAYAVIILWIIALISLAILGSFANSVVNVALYYYANNQQVPPGFSAEMLNGVFIKRRHRFFGK